MPYLFCGVVRPERAPLSLETALEFTHVVTGFTGIAKVSIVLNQVAVCVDSEHEWDLFDLRNVITHIVQGELAMVGYLKGYAYGCEIVRVLNQDRGIDYVFGIDVPCIAGRGESADLAAVLARLRETSSGPRGVLLHRCFADLASALKNADDTGFYCYRAIESLLQHCAAVHPGSTANKASQWRKFREVAGCGEERLRSIKAAADPQRHGSVFALSSGEREKLLTSTWDVVDGYLRSASSEAAAAGDTPAEVKGPAA